MLSSSNVVIGYWNTLRTWTATGSTVPYTKFDQLYPKSMYAADLVLASTTGFTTRATLLQRL